ncbi:hypothetical protein Ssi03_34400 [Sphaerisporangium siamense]|uniref:Uncharacterized protein n=1 Tax=Sphaerisporangium siamense TaxID=795645 RepID=A0A7W7D1A6_9ACTN|nr:hypothetical protein [Sphaerisporangium siamense]MBB4698490.1 hypothetical protein [Sphaerisporangium siamense]GII85450.1 hypothetical protein Ssi03_34400 [Sphaerisporangium siamense]
MSVHVPPPRRAAARPIERRTVHQLFLLAELAASPDADWDSLLWGWESLYDYDFESFVDGCLLSRNRETARSALHLIECTSSADERGFLYGLVCDDQGLNPYAAFPTYTAIYMTILNGIAGSNPPVVHRLDEALRMVTRCKPVIKDFHRGKCVCGCDVRHQADRIRDFMRLSGALRGFVEDDAGLFWVIGPDEFVDRFRDWLKADSRPCRHCGALLASYGFTGERSASGRPRLYCTDACRQAEYRKRAQRMKERGGSRPND